MNKLKTIFVVLITVIIAIGINFKHIDNNNYKVKLEKYQEKLKKYKEDSIKIIKSISAPVNAISYKVSSASEAYQSASQGIDVHLRGLSWRNYFLDNNENIIKQLENDFDAYYTRTIEKIQFDPDFPDNGYPDLIIDIKSSPSFYRPTLFSEYLGNIGLSEPKPYKSYELNSCDKRKAMMDLWLVTFDISFRIEPNFEYSKNKEIVFEGKHPITRSSDNSIRKKKEYDDRRYDRMSVYLEFKPKDFFYLSSNDNASNLTEPLNKSPKIGIGAVECIFINKVGEQGLNNDATRIGVVIEKGKSLPLYPNLDELKRIYSRKNTEEQENQKKQITPVKDMVSDYENIVDICDQEVVTADTNFFNKSKFSIIDLKNLGSWKQQKEWFLGANKYNADYYHAQFLVHLYVLGEWVVKDENLISFEARPPAKYEKPSLLDYLFPDFNLGIGGKFLSAVLIPVLIILILSFFFPSIKKVVNKLIEKLFSKIINDN